MRSKDKSLNSGSIDAKSLDALVSRWVRPEVRELSAYHVPPSGGMIKLDAMENPYAWPRGRQSLELDALDINRYPDASAVQLTESIRTAFGIPVHFGILLGNGSDELIQIIALTLAGHDRVVMAPEPGFVMYRMIALMCGMKFVGVPLNSDFSLDLQAMLEAISRHNPAVIYFAYPNNPTGNLFDAGKIESVIQHTEGLVVVDEAYFAFAGDSFLERLDQYENLLIMRTVSKMGLAGLRLGYLAGRPEWIDEFNKMRLPYNINIMTQQVACMALENIEKFNEQTERICADRQLMFDRLTAIDSLDVFPSRANFILFRVKGNTSTEVFDRLKERNILVKNLGSQPGLLHNCLRVTIGTAEENDAFIAAMVEIAGIKT